MERKALGKGLGLTALLPAAETGKEMVREIEVDKIIPNRYQPRQNFDHDALASLAASLRRHGLVQPITVRKEANGKFELIAGERRWRAARMAGLSKIPALVKGVQDRDLMEWALLENIQREDLNPIEKAQAYARLISQFSLTQEEIAARIGIDRSSVANFLRLLQLPEPLWKEIAEERLTMGHAKALLSLEKKGDRLRLAEEIKAKGLSVRQAEAIAQKRRDARSAKRPNVESATTSEILEIEGRLRLALGTKVRLRPRKKGGRIEI
ncbi:MAG: ParB/RepB/Spo0J family partition protein, partial [Nitrospiria bacterium]